MSKDGRSTDWEDLLREVVSVCTSLLDLIGEPDSLHNTFAEMEQDGADPLVCRLSCVRVNMATSLMCQCVDVVV